MKIIQVDMHEAEARALLAFLNADEGLRAAVVERLIPQNRPENIARWTSITAAFGRLSAALSAALGGK